MHPPIHFYSSLKTQPFGLKKLKTLTSEEVWSLESGVWRWKMHPPIHFYSSLKTQPSV